MTDPQVPPPGGFSPLDPTPSPGPAPWPDQGSGSAPPAPPTPPVPPPGTPPPGWPTGPATSTGPSWQSGPTGPTWHTGGAPGWQPSATPRPNGLATASLVCGIVGVVLCFTFILSLLAVVFGLVSRSAISKSNGMQTGQSRATWGTVLGVVGLLIFGALVAVGMSSDDSGTSFEDVSDVIAGDLAPDVGECVTVPEGSIVFDIDTVPCSEPHDGEVFSTGDLDDSGDRAYPGDAEVLAEVSQACSSAFESYVGIVFGESELDIYYLYPRREGWSRDSGYVCIAVNLDGSPLTGSVKGSGR